MPSADELRALLIDHIDWFALLLAGETHDDSVDILELVNGELGRVLPEQTVSLFLAAVLKRRGVIGSGAAIDPPARRYQ